MTYYNFDKLAADMGVLRRFARQKILKSPRRTKGHDVEAAIAAGPALVRQKRRLRRALLRGKPGADEAFRKARAALDVNRRTARGDRAGYDFGTDQFLLHGPQANAADRLLGALHEGNERRATKHIENKLRKHVVGFRHHPSPIPHMRVPLGMKHLHLSSHMTPSVPLRDFNIANTATGEGADELRKAMRRYRTRENYPFRGTEVDEIAADVPGARAILQNAGVIPGAPRPETPRYVRYAQRRLRGENPDAVAHRVLDRLGVPMENINVQNVQDRLRKAVTPELRGGGIVTTPLALLGTPLSLLSRHLRGNKSLESRTTAGIDSAVSGLGDIADRTGIHGRLVGAKSPAPLSDAVRARLQQMVDRHAERIAPGPARLNQSELRMIDNAFYRKYSKDRGLQAAMIEEPLASGGGRLKYRGKSVTTPLPAEQRDAFREAVEAQPGLTRKQFMASPRG